MLLGGHEMSRTNPLYRNGDPPKDRKLGRSKAANSQPTLFGEGKA